jgi:hypothetical protein
MRFVRLVLRCFMSRTKNQNKKKTHSNFHSVVIELYTIDCVTLRCVACNIQRIPNKNKKQGLSLNSTVGCIALRNVSATDTLSQPGNVVLAGKLAQVTNKSHIQMCRQIIFICRR